MVNAKISFQTNSRRGMHNGSGQYHTVWENILYPAGARLRTYVAKKKHLDTIRAPGFCWESHWNKSEICCSNFSKSFPDSVFAPKPNKSINNGLGPCDDVQVSLQDTTHCKPHGIFRGNKRIGSRRCQERNTNRWTTFSKRAAQCLDSPE